jgi:hypothetical protein
MGSAEVQEMRGGFGFLCFGGLECASGNEESGADGTNVVQECVEAPASTPAAQAHNFLAPLAPPDTRVLVHEKSSARSTWSPHAVNGWYRVPVTNHYCCYRVYEYI